MERAVVLIISSVTQRLNVGIDFSVKGVGISSPEEYVEFLGFVNTELRLSLRKLCPMLGTGNVSRTAFGLRFGAGNHR